MAHTGPPGKGLKHGRTPSAAEWTDVPDRPYTGPSPDLPRLPKGKRWQQPVEAWWETVRRMPHAMLWAPSDWQYALETAYLRQAFWAQFADGDVHVTMATELRRRDDNLGTTVEARRKLRIRYLDPSLFDDPDVDVAVVLPPAPGDGQGGDATVTDLDSRRNRLTG